MGHQIPHFAREGGYVQQRYIDLYEAFAKGGAGLVTIASDIGRVWDEGFSVTEDKYMPRLRDLTDAAHKYDCPIFLHLYHVGPWDSANHIASSKEKEFEIKPALKNKKVVVVGGGPGGMEAARVAALRGHHVILFEKNMLGGAANIAAVAKGTEREDILGLVDYLKTQITKAGVDIRLGKEATKEVIEELEPDVVIIAAGAVHNTPDFQGITGKNVFTSAALHDQMKKYLKITGARLMTKLATKYVPIGKKVVIMGGSIQGCQTAEFLAKRGREVAILETGPRIGDGMMPRFLKPQLLDWLEKHNIEMLADVKIEEITDKGVVAVTVAGTKQTFEADTVLTAVSMLPNTQLIDSLQGSAAEVYTIGDCRKPNLIAEAINEGSKTAREL